MKICIPSKNRSALIKTHLFFKPEDVLIFVEPQEVKRYKIFCPEYEIIDILKSNQGLSYARNFILEYVKEDKIIMADDDISFFGVRQSNHRYDSLLFNSEECLQDIEKGLDTYCGYSLPVDMFTFFANKISDKRLYENTRYLTAFYGLNLLTMKKHNIRFDPDSLVADDIDISTQILLANENIVIDFQYAFRHELRTEGGLSEMRKNTSFNVDECFRNCVEKLGKKYGFEFLKLSRTEDGYLKSYYLDLQLLLKRKEIAKRNMEKYYSEIAFTNSKK